MGRSKVPLNEWGGKAKSSKVSQVVSIHVLLSSFVSEKIAELHRNRSSQQGLKDLGYRLGKGSVSDKQGYFGVSSLGKVIQVVAADNGDSAVGRDDFCMKRVRTSEFIQLYTVPKQPSTLIGKRRMGHYLIRRLQRVRKNSNLNASISRGYQYPFERRGDHAVGGGNVDRTSRMLHLFVNSIRDRTRCIFLRPYEIVEEFDLFTLHSDCRGVGFVAML